MGDRIHLPVPADNGSGSDRKDSKQELKTSLVF